MGSLIRARLHLTLRASHGYLHLLFMQGTSGVDYALLFVGVLSAIIAGMPFPILSILFGQLVDDLNSTSCRRTSQSVDRSEQQSSVQNKVVLIVYISIGNFLAIYTAATCWTLFGERLVGRLRRQYFQSLLRQEIAFFDGLPSGEVSTRLTTDMDTIRAGTSEKVGLFITSLAYFGGAYVVAFLKVPALAGMLTFMIPAYILLVSVGGRYIGRYTTHTSDSLASAASLVLQTISHVALVHALDAQQRLECKLVTFLDAIQKAAIKKSLAAAIQFGFMFLVAYSANALAFWQGSKQIVQAAENVTSNVTAGSVYTVIFVLLDGTPISFVCQCNF